MKIEILTIGNELLNGDLADTNTAHFGGWLRRRGLSVHRGQTVPDVPDAIIVALDRAARRSDVVLVSGGLGPTDDDLTLAAAADWVGVPLVQDAPTLARLKERFARRGYPPAVMANNAQQAQVPQGARALANPVGTAPCVHLTHRRTDVWFFPGVPRELARLLDDHLGPWLAEVSGATPYISATFKTFGRTESKVASMLEGMVSDPRLHVAYRAHFPEIRVSLHVQDDDPDSGAFLLARAATDVRRRLGDIVYSEAPDRSLAAVVGELLVDRGHTLSAAESCTGGLIASLCVAEAGASRWFLEGAVTYSNAAKATRLGVPAALIAEHGAVSEAVARAMAKGIRTTSGSDWGVATTGIAGPGGGTEDKPVGTVHLAVAGPDGVIHRRRRFPFDRDRNRRVSAWLALDLLRRALSDQA